LTPKLHVGTGKTGCIRIHYHSIRTRTRPMKRIAYPYQTRGYGYTRRPLSEASLSRISGTLLKNVEPSRFKLIIVSPKS